MTKFQVVKTVTYDLVADIEVENMTADEVISMIERDGDGWIDWEQSDGNDEVLTAYEIEESK